MIDAPHMPSVTTTTMGHTLWAASLFLRVDEVRMRTFTGEGSTSEGSRHIVPRKITHFFWQVIYVFHRPVRLTGNHAKPDFLAEGDLWN